jgi:peroxiredoxin
MFSKHAARLWQYSQEHPDRTQKVAGAPAAALAYWVLAGEGERADRLLDNLPDQPKQVQGIIANLLTTARITGDYASAVNWEKHILKRTQDKTRRAGLYLAIARAYQLGGDRDSAQAALASAARESNEPRIQEAVQKLKGNLSDVSERLAVGQPALDFHARTATGESVSLSDLRGKVVVINVAASYCPICLSELPSLKQMYEKDKDKGLVILSVLLDEEIEPVQKMVARYKIPWPQIVDGLNGPVTSHYQASGTPTYYVVANGKMIGNSVPISQLPAIISAALEKTAAAAAGE